MTLTASWNGASLELWDGAGERHALFESAATAQDTDASDVDSAELPEAAFGDWSALAVSDVDAPVSCLLLPVELLLQRFFSLPLAHSRFVDAAVLGQELDDQAGIEPQDWWLCWQVARGEDGVHGLVFALPEVLKDELSSSSISRDCRFVAPDIAVRLAACLPEGVGRGAVLDADDAGLMLGLIDGGVWRGMRRLNIGAKADMPGVAENARRSLVVMGFAAATMPVFGSLDSNWIEAFGPVAQEAAEGWQVEQVGVPGTRHAANATALRRLQGEPPFNFRYGRWALQSDWKKRFEPWRRAAVLAGVLTLLVMGHDAYQSRQLGAQQQAVRQGIEAAFHKALPGVAMVDPLLQLRQAAGGDVDGDAWFFIRQLQAIAALKKKEDGFLVQVIRYSDSEITLNGTVMDFAAANRVRDALSSILGRKVELVDTDLDGERVRIRLRWS